MATVSFDRKVSVNPDWGVKNLESAVNNAKDLSSMYSEYKPYRKVSKDEIKKFTEEYRKCR